MAGTEQLDTKSKELVVGKKAARLLQSGIRQFIGIETVRGTGQLLSTTTTARAGTYGLASLIIRSPRYGFMLNYGFEGVKSNGVSMRLKGTNHLANAIERTGVLEILADELTDIKGEKVLASINFKIRGN